MIARDRGDPGRAGGATLPDIEAELFEQGIDLFCRRSSQLYLRFFADGTIIRASASCLEQLGYSPEELQGRAVADFLHLDDPRRSFAEALAQAAGGLPVETQCRWLDRVGRPVLLGWYLNRCPAAAGPPAVEGWARLVRQHAPAPLQATSRFPDVPVQRSVPLTSQIAFSLLTSPLHGVIVVGPGGSVQLVNPQVTLLTGYPAEELRRAPDWLDLLVPDAAARRSFYERTEASLSQEEAYLAELEVTTRSGEKRALRVALVPLRGSNSRAVGRVVLLSAAIRKPRAPELAEVVLDSLPHGVAVVDPSGVLLYANPAYRKIFGGADQGQTTGALLGDHPLWQGAGLASWLRRALQLPQGSMAKLDGVVLQGQVGGGRLAVGMRAFSLPPDKEGRRGLLLLGEDVSAQKSLEERLRHATKMEALGTMAGGIVHDYNNMLGAILNFAAVIVDALPPDTPQAEDAQAILGIARQATSLTRQLMSIGRPEQPGSPVALNRLVQDTVRLLRRTIPKSIQIRQDLAEDLLPALGSVGQLEQCLLNLCLNACEAMPTGGTLSIATANVVLSEAEATARAGAQAGRHVLLQVQDSGCGIEPEQLQHIFDPFFTTKPEGTGLGLAMVRSTVQSHHGHIMVESTPGKGTAMQIHLPVAERSLDQPPSPTEQKELLSGSETLLLVDDAPTIRLATRHLLTSKGYLVLEAADGADAVEIFRRHSKEISLVLLEIDIPQTGAAQVIAELRRLEPEAKVLLLSGYDPGSTADELRALGTCGVLAKPWEGAELLRRLRAVLDG